MATELDYAYAAGYIDGEGCISVTPHQKCKTTAYWRLKVETCDYTTLLWFRDTFGGNLLATTLRHNSKKQPWSWKISGITAVTFLMNVKLIAKESQRKIFIDTYNQYQAAPKASELRATIVKEAKEKLQQEKKSNVIR